MKFNITRIRMDNPSNSKFDNGYIYICVYFQIVLEINWHVITGNINNLRGNINDGWL